MNKKVFTLDEFAKVFGNSKQHYDKSEPIAVQTFGKIEKEVFNEVNPTEGQTQVVVKAYHDQTNLNGTTIASEVFVEKTDSIKLRPILANIVEHEDGTKDFGAHDYDIEFDDEGNMTFVYQERPVGVISDYHFEFDSASGVNRAVTRGYMFDEYNADAVKILTDRGNVDCSVELFIKDFHYDEESDQLFLDDYFVAGVTLLGADHAPGMAGSNVGVYEDSQDETEEEAEEIAEAVAEPEEQPQDVISEPETNPATDDENIKPDEDAEIDEAPAFSLHDELAKTNSTLSELDFIVIPSINQVLYAKEDNLYADFYDKETYVLFGDPKEQLNFDIEEDIERYEREMFLEEQVAKLTEELASYRAAAEESAKAALLEDELYQEYLDTDSFKEIISASSDMTASEMEAKFALAFAQEKRNETQKDAVLRKTFANPNKPTPSAYEIRYGKTFGDKRKEKE